MELQFRDHACQRLHAAVGAERDLVGRYGLDHLADAIGDHLRRLDGVRANVEDTDLRALVRGQVLEELDAVHVAIGIVEHELVDAGRADEVGAPSDSPWGRRR